MWHARPDSAHSRTGSEISGKGASLESNHAEVPGPRTDTTAGRTGPEEDEQGRENACLIPVLRRVPAARPLDARCALGAAEGCPGRYTLTAENPAVQHTGVRPLSTFSSGTTRPGFRQQRGCLRGGVLGLCVCVGGALVPSHPPHPRGPHWGLVKLWEQRQKVTQPLRGAKAGAKLSGLTFQCPGLGSPASL